MGLGTLAAAVDELVATEAAELADGEAVVELERQLARLEAVVTRATAAFEATGAYAGDGARSAAMWLATRTRRPKAQTRHQVGLGRRLRHLPHTEAAWLAGELAEAHARALAGARTPATATRFAADEAMLVGLGTTLGYPDFARALAYWAQLADPDGAEDADDRRRAARRVHLSPTLDGSWFGSVVLDPVSGAAVAGELGRLEQALFRADRAEAEARLGRTPTPAELTRTPAQRRADALVEMAARSASATGRRAAPRFLVHVGWATLHGRICELADGTVISPGTAVSWLDGATLERVVFDAPSRVLDVGRRRRLFRGATREAIVARDRGCFHHYCDERSPTCEADHIVPYGAEGPTIVDNGRLACGFHNRERHRRGPPGP